MKKNKVRKKLNMVEKAIEENKIIVFDGTSEYKEYCKKNERHEKKVISRVKKYFSDKDYIDLITEKSAEILYGIIALDLPIELAEMRVEDFDRFRAEMESFV